MTTFNGFDDLASDDFGDVIVSPSMPATMEDASGNESLHAVKGFVEDCPKCRGTGIYKGWSSLGRQCFKCGGKGKLTFKTSADQRQKARSVAAKSKLVKGSTNLEKFEAQYPTIAAWWADSDFAFAVSLKGAVVKYGTLTDGQLRAALSCVDKFNAAKARAVEAVAKAETTTVDISGIQKALTKAKGNGLKNPKVRMLADGVTMVMSLAKETSVNAGAVYVKANDSTYVGKIANGHFYPSRDCGSTMADAILTACQTPVESAVAYGRRTGSCSCCGRELTDAKSIDLGIGPVCLSKFFG
jgi:hypothetical protein